MTKTIDTNPDTMEHKHWKDAIVIWNHDNYSVIVGFYDGSEIPTIGKRWNTSDTSKGGYPNSRGNPRWYVEKHTFRDYGILNVLDLLTEEACRPDITAEELDSLRDRLRKINKAIALIYPFTKRRVELTCTLHKTEIVVYDRIRALSVE